MMYLLCFINRMYNTYTRHHTQAFTMCIILEILNIHITFASPRMTLNQTWTYLFGCEASGEPASSGPSPTHPSGHDGQPPLSPPRAESPAPGKLDNSLTPPPSPSSPEGSSPATTPPQQGNQTPSPPPSPPSGDNNGITPPHVPPPPPAPETAGGYGDFDPDCLACIYECDTVGRTKRGNICCLTCSPDDYMTKATSTQLQSMENWLHGH